MQYAPRGRPYHVPTLLLISVLLLLALAIAGPLWAVEPNLAHRDWGTSVEVDGYGYTQYQHNEDLLNNGEATVYDETDPWTRSWQSSSASAPHWAAFHFTQAFNINKVRIYWNYKSGSGGYQTILNSAFKIQRWSGSAWVDITSVTRTAAEQYTEVTFTAVSTSRIRLYHATKRWWMTEVQIWGSGYESIDPTVNVDIALKSSVVGTTDDDLYLELHNKTGSQKTGSLSYQILSADRSTTLASGTLSSLVVPASGWLEPSISLSSVSLAEHTGYIFIGAWDSGSNHFARTRRFYAIVPTYPVPQDDLTIHTTLLDTINCASTYGSDRYVDSGQASVVNGGALGNYREAGNTQGNRFAYRLTTLGTVGTPHLIEIDYPDDKLRCQAMTHNYRNYAHAMCSPTMGDFLGGEYDITNSIKTRKMYFWPWEGSGDMAITVGTYMTGQPAAAKTIRVYQVTNSGGFPPAQVEDATAAAPREFGNEWEDPDVFEHYGAKISSFLPNQTPASMEDADLATVNMCQYMNFNGMSLLKYPIWFYHGPYYESEVEIWNRDARMWLHPNREADWVDLLLRRCEDNGIKFMPSLTMLRIPSLIYAPQQVDEAAVKAGADTLNMILRNDGVRPSADAAAKLTYDGTSRYTSHKGPAFNCLRPEVQAKILAGVDEILNKYGDSPAFTGLSFNMWNDSLLWLGSLYGGYGDWETAEYIDDTSSSIPTYTGNTRFSQRYTWLMANEKEEWINWRCERVYALWEQIYNHVKARRSDLQLHMTLWIPYRNNYLDYEAGLRRYDPAADDQTVAEIHREGGIDLEMFKGIDDMSISFLMNPSCYRWIQMAFPTQLTSAQKLLARSIHFDTQAIADVANTPEVGAWFFNRYWETSIGEDSPLPNYWWTDDVWRSGAITPGHSNYMEYYTHAMASLDPGFLVDSGHHEPAMGYETEVRNFARAFRGLPKVAFTTVSGTTGTITARQATVSGGYFLYVVNETDTSTNATVPLPSSGMTLRNLVTNTFSTIGGSTLSVTVPAYTLISYASSYYLTVNTSPAGCSLPTPTGEGWYQMNKTATTCTAPSTVMSGGHRYAFVGWSLDGGGTSGTNPRSVTMGAAHTLTAVYAEEVDHVVLAPSSSSIGSGETQTYTLTAYDPLGNSWSVSTASGTSYSISGGAGGSWGSGGTKNVYTSANAGTWTVTGSYGGESDDSSLTVTDAGTYTLSGLCKQNGNPISGGNVFACQSNYSQLYTATTSGYTMQLPAGTYYIYCLQNSKNYVVEGTSNRSATVTLNSGNPSATVNFTASTATTYTIQGTVATGGGTGVGGVAVAIVNGTLRAVKSTYSNGTYNQVGCWSAAFTLTPTKAGYHFSPTSTTVTPTSSPTVVNFTAIPD